MADSPDEQKKMDGKNYDQDWAKQRTFAAPTGWEVADERKEVWDEYRERDSSGS